jgi:hypothetical protein
MTTADERKPQDNEKRQREAWRSSRLQAMLAIVAAAAVAIVVLAAGMQAWSSLNEWACKMNWSTVCASGSPLDLSPPEPGAR